MSGKYLKEFVQITLKPKALREYIKRNGVIENHVYSCVCSYIKTFHSGYPCVEDVDKHF